jgi:hypothetical protein
MVLKESVLLGTRTPTPSPLRPPLPKTLLPHIPGLRVECNATQASVHGTCWCIYKMRPPVCLKAIQQLFVLPIESKVDQGFSVERIYRCTSLHFLYTCFVELLGIWPREIIFFAEQELSIPCLNLSSRLAESSSFSCWL